MQESSISEKIKELRTDLKMNQKNFSAAIGIRQSTLSSYENGVVTPSNDVLLTIAQKFHVSLDWLFGLSENKVQISTLSDIIWVLLQMNESNELRYELDINNKLPGDIETETQKWYAGLRFYGNNPEHSLNADMCNFLADLQENRESLESYFTGKDMFDMWKKQTLEYYTSKPVTHKEIEELDFETRIRKRDELLTQKFSNNEQKQYHNSITGRYAKVFIFFPYLPVFNLFAILYSLILNFYTTEKPRKPYGSGVSYVWTQCTLRYSIYIIKMLC